jgi:hypothetical protein
MNTRDDVVKHYRTVPEDFVKHLFTTLAIVLAAVLLASIFFGVPEKQPMTIRGYAGNHPVAFEQMTLRALDGQGQIASYGPPYNHGTASLQTPMQSWVGVLHPINAATGFVLTPLKDAAAINPAIGTTLKAFAAGTGAQQARWEANYTKALTKGVYKNGKVVTAPGNYGPLPALLNHLLDLGKSGLMGGALLNENNGSFITKFDNQNYVLFLQGAPLQNAPQTQALQGPNWGIIHPAVYGYPGAWWMTIPTWIYQWGFVANSSAPDALALTVGFLFWLLLALIPWIPGLNRLPRYLGVHRLIWRDFYRHQTTDEPPQMKGGNRNAS